MVNIFKKKKKVTMTEEQYRKIAEIIKAEAPFWSVLETDILVLLLKTAVRKYSDDNPEESFAGLTDEQLQEKVREAFLNYDTSSVTQDGLFQLNAVYKKGKAMGVDMNKAFKRVTKLRDMIKWKKSEEPSDESEKTG
jgi:hypothetical protein